MDEDRTQESVNKGRRAEQLLKNEAFQEACAALTQQLMDRWKICTDQTERDRIWTSVNLIDQIKSKLGTAMSNGKISQKKLEELTGARPV